MRQPLTILFLFLVACAAVACASSEELRPTPESSPTTAPTQSVPTAADPTLPTKATVLGRGTLQLVIPSKEPSQVNPVEVAANDRIDAPACAGFLFSTSWLVTSPASAGDAGLTVAALNQGSRAPLGNGSSGKATTGCDVLEFANGSDGPVTVELRYIVASIT